jgi:hypothetical protein
MVYIMVIVSIALPYKMMISLLPNESKNLLFSNIYCLTSNNSNGIKMNKSLEELPKEDPIYYLISKPII